KYPNSAHVLQQLADVYSEQGDYAAARDMLEAMEALYPANTALKQNIAKLSFYHGDSGRAFRMLNQLYDGAGSPSIPVLLYHGVTVSDRQDTMPLKKFRE